MSSDAKIIGITIGDGAGVGPELILTQWRRLREDGPLVVYGSVEVLDAALACLRDRGVREVPDDVVDVDQPHVAPDVPAGSLCAIDVGVNVPNIESAAYPWGKVVPEFGLLQYKALTYAIEDAQADAIDAIMTAPWNKKRLADAGLPPTGHTEVLAQVCGVDEVLMLLAGDVLRVGLATVHIPLRRVAEELTEERIVRALKIFDRGLRTSYGIKRPRIACCGLNPHAGEGGVIGSEDDEVIAPAIDRARERGVDAYGPIPADTLFPRVANGRVHYDGILAMYHDQGLGPLKTWHFGEAANVTLGLPIIRTSVDHGTAYDIAGTGRVDPSSFLYATRLARRMASANDRSVGT